MENIKPIHSTNQELIELVLEMRSVMDALNHSTHNISLSEATQEANSYFSNNRLVFGIYQNETILGFLVLKIEDSVCWLDWIFVRPDYRGTDIASKLFKHAEEFSLEMGNDQLYVWVHPDNHRMLKFLKKKGYDVLNLIEVKKEKSLINTSISILGNEFRY